VSENVVDQSGSAIIGLLHQAAEATKADVEHATQTAHQLAMQLRATEDRAAKLQEQVKQFEQQALQAEDWLRRIHDEIENRFFRNRQEHDRSESRQRAP
jgi:molecular chaperone GrpE (heat shock protein)